MPRVSVVMPSYNLDRFIGKSIQSILDQTYQDFEIIITDDGSSDGTVSVIKQFTDPRIQLEVFPQNKGATIAINNCIQNACGLYVAVLNSDDIWEPSKLEKQVAFLDEHPGISAVFTKVEFIDEEGNLGAAEKAKRPDVFNMENRSRYAWLNHFFFRGNCLCHPSVLIRKKCYDEIGLYNSRMSVLPDFDMWVRLCMKYDIHIMDEKLVRFRIFTGETNASGDILPTHIRIHFEILPILDHYLSIRNKEEFLGIFPEASRYGEVENRYIPYFLGRLAQNMDDSSWRLWSLKVLYDFMADESVEKELAEKYGFRYRDFLKLTAEYDIFHLGLLVPPPPPPPLVAHLIEIDPQKHGALVNFAVKMHNTMASVMIKLYVWVGGLLARMAK